MRPGREVGAPLPRWPGASDYQARCAAWFLGHLLAGSAAPPSIDLWAGPLVRVDCETNDAVDDIRVTAGDWTASGAPVQAHDHYGGLSYWLTGYCGRPQGLGYR